MAVAMIYPEPEKGGRGKKGLQVATVLDKSRLSQARTIVKASTDLAERVINGTKT